mmetsp:Transcript_58456/g.94560  ORF Transcript_58456/g.94560 Transcript_58456/m.94560 type:complete len:180 (+) Transcript_58456:881-1420(+)
MEFSSATYVPADVEHEAEPKSPRSVEGGFERCSGLKPMAQEASTCAAASGLFATLGSSLRVAVLELLPPLALRGCGSYNRVGLFMLRVGELWFDAALSHESGAWQIELLELPEPLTESNRLIPASRSLKLASGAAAPGETSPVLSLLCLSTDGAPVDGVFGDGAAQPNPSLGAGILLPP